MSFVNVLYDIIILPIESIIEFVFCFVVGQPRHFGIIFPILAVSLTVNFLALPIYNVADEIQLRERNLQKKMSRWVTHIKKTFHGDEQFMMLSEYYRQNNYHPLYALRQSLSILIEVPFFIAAYHFLSHCSQLEGKGFWLLKDLSKPDALIHLTMGGGINNSGFALNLLPILMTAINVVSSLIYTKGAPIREKIQTNALAIIFLVILYNSPSGLVLYWILNNLFSLGKNIVKRLPHPGWILYCGVNLLFLAATLYVVFSTKNGPHKTFACLCTALLILAPIAYNLFLKSKLFNSLLLVKENSLLVLMSCVSLWLLCGLVLPSSAIATSPAEFSFLGDTASPLSYVFSSALYFFGLFVVWPITIYKLFSDDKKNKTVIQLFLVVISLCALANVFIFKYKYGNINVFFQFDTASISYSPFYTILPLLFLAFFFVLILVLSKYKKLNYAVFAMIVLCVAELFIGVKNVSSINKEFIVYSKIKDEEKLLADSASKNGYSMYNLSKTEKNVFVIFLDMAVSHLFPYIIEQFPELKSSFDGFTYFPNTVSFANFTNCGTPALLGGYDYTIDSLNKRDKELLKDKHNEALKVMPVVFENAGFDSTIYELPYEDYGSGKNIWEGTNVKKVVFPDQLKNEFYGKNLDLLNKNPDKTVTASARLFSLLQIVYPPIRGIIYGGGTYYQESLTLGTLNDLFMTEYVRLEYMNDVTSFNSQRPTFHHIYNGIAHEPTTLIEGYVPGLIDAEHHAAGTGSFKPSNQEAIDTYHVTAAAMLQFAKWFDFLKENEAYNNTRIIIVADHGHSIKLPCFEGFVDENFLGRLNPLLLVKDFNAHGEPVTDMSLHTNADTVYFATKDLDVSKTNPFTGNEFKFSSDFDSFNIYRIPQSNVHYYQGKTKFDWDAMYTVHDNIFDKNNWEKDR